MLSISSSSADGSALLENAPAVSAVSLRREVAACTRIGLPLALGELGWMSTYIVDALMIGRLPHSAAAIAASSLGNTIYYAIAFFAIYLLNGLETYVSQAAGRNDKQECVRMLAQSMWIVVLATPLVMLLTLGFGTLLPRFGVSRDVALITQTYLRALVWSTVPLMLYMALRRFLQSINRVGLITASLVTSGAVNLLFDWLLLYGHWHMPAMGLAGSGWATVVVRFWMLLLLVPGVVFALRQMHQRPRLATLRPDAARLRALLQVGWPSGLEFSLELGISTFMSLLCARLGTNLLAAHQVALDLNAFVYMVPTGLSYAAMIRVGQAAGRNDLRGVRSATKATMLLALGYGAIAAVAFLSFAHKLASFYTTDNHVVAAATPLFWLCSVLILGDAAFVVQASALTGLGDTRTPLWVSVFCNWVLGMPAAYLLAFPLGYGAVGLWMGRAIASVSSGLLLTVLWQHRMRSEAAADATHSIALLSPLRVR
ncbi:putative efflux protein, MATE family [Terriglobus roseus DSM 18391]|uniref:Multidrug-efflux transporter n=1 Tax=Terriglobus roseus (strain DSM 18391 / NRRL B-41598 / KBS 63) TaxID=926566 RepID=I3ZHF4_TERRK|nr:putative efflux protein, MATE family [Terriglobus roseus DSM 18391]AFL88672.1 putative efflux protein, MATE family [Terriglobus roseus DSM 18391]